MKTKLLWAVGLICSLLGFPADGSAAAITELDSTQPRGATPAPDPERSPSLRPVTDGFRAPAYWANEHDAEYADWVGTIMANATRDPAFFATLSVANQDLIDLIASLPGEPEDPSSPLGAFLKANKLGADIRRAEDGSLGPEELLPIAADLCLRCHSPVGWLEAHSEPPTRSAPFLKGQFWGAAFRSHPVDPSGKPRPVDLAVESETEMEGIGCSFCHRAIDASKRKSRYNESVMANGNGGFFVDPKSPFCVQSDEEGGCLEEAMDVVHDFLAEPDFCGACHDVTNPLLKTKTRIGGEIPDMNHPIERTYTEWYWSGYRDEETCQDCHQPMTFEGAQIDQVWRGDPYGYTVPKRVESYRMAAEANRTFMKESAEVGFVETPVDLKKGKDVTVKVKVTNHTGHKLPTGFSEGRQMWIHIRAVDGSGKLLFEDGILKDGYLVRTPETKVYEQIVAATGYPFLDENQDGQVDEKESHFHFVLMNDVRKDNRIPPKGYNKAAYQADGAFIVPRDPKDTDYADGQHWDITPYRFAIPKSAKGPVRVEARLLYQTFSREYVEFLKEHDREKTQACGGRARNLPATGRYGGNCNSYDTWGKVFYDLWKKSGMGPPVEVGIAAIELLPGG
jgi:hypothetical protein